MYFFFSFSTVSLLHTASALHSPGAFHVLGTVYSTAAQPLFCTFTLAAHEWCSLGNVARLPGPLDYLGIDPVIPLYLVNSWSKKKNWENWSNSLPVITRDRNSSLGALCGGLSHIILTRTSKRNWWDFSPFYRWGKWGKSVQVSYPRSKSW